MSVWVDLSALTSLCLGAVAPSLLASLRCSAELPTAPGDLPPCVPGGRLAPMDWAIDASRTFYLVARPMNALGHKCFWNVLLSTFLLLDSESCRTSTLQLRIYLPFRYTFKQIDM